MSTPLPYARTAKGGAPMRIVISEFMSLDGVVQAPGGPDEDTVCTYRPVAGGRGSRAYGRARRAAKYGGHRSSTRPTGTGSSGAYCSRN